MDTKKQTFRYGGQAVFEGVMMRGKHGYALSVRHIDGDIHTKLENIEKPPKSWKSLPFIRGIFAFVSSMKLGMKLINDSFDMAGFEEETSTSPFDLWMEAKLGDKMMPIMMGFSMVFGVLLSMGLFVFLPVWLVSFLSIPLWAKSILEGLCRMFIFFVYLLLISNNKDIHRVLSYHGAEHKTIHCYENNLPLTIENANKQSRLHKRCGTSFLFLVMLISMVLFIFVRVDTLWLRFFTRILAIPLVAGISYEVLQWAGRSDSILVDIISYPGLMSQKLSTKEPDDKQLEVAITSLQQIIQLDEKPMNCLGDELSRETPPKVGEHEA